MAFALLLAVTLSSCSNRPTPSSGSDQPAGSPGWKPQTIYEALPPDRPVPGLDDAQVQEGIAVGDVIYTFVGDRETFDFEDPTNYLHVDNDVWRYALPTP